MTVQDVYNAIQLRFPEMNEPLFLMALNSALQEFTAETKILSGNSVSSTIQNKRFYDLPDDILQIIRVDYDGEKIDGINGNLVPDSVGYAFNPPQILEEEEVWAGPQIPIAE
jgi:hypothetical protein